MARYQWPAAPQSTDDPGGRAGHRARFLPQADVRHADGSLDPLPKARAPRRRRRAVAKDFPLGGLHLWLPIGPSEMIRGQATNRPSVAGRIADLQVEPTAGRRIYAASGGGGVWYSGDGGASWSPLDEFIVSPNRHTVTPTGSALACGAVHVRWGAAANGADDEVFVGTGENKPFSNAANPDPGNPHPGANLVGIGILHAVGPALGNPWLIDQGGEQLRGETVARIVASPRNPADLYAATNAGLWHRPDGGSWIRLTADIGYMDVAVTSHGAADLRIWLTDFTQVLMATVTPPVAGPVVFNPVTLTPAALNPTNKSFAQPVTGDLWVLGRVPGSKPTGLQPAALWKIASGDAAPTGAGVTGVPAGLFGERNDQSWYDMCLAVHPDDPAQLIVGGSAVMDSGEWNAALYRLTVSGTTADHTFIGSGVHSDVHAIRYGESSGGTRSVWLGCDGGVFRSVSNGAPRTVLPVNRGLAVLEPGFVACHPTNDGLVAIGNQDNGTVERIGDSVWTLTHGGDGGGVVYDPSSEHRFYRQYTQATWESSDGGGIPPVHRRGDGGENSSESIEGKSSLFYSGVAALSHGGRTHLLLGTNRPWYSADWGRTWMTVPAGRDPRHTDNVDLALDVLKPTVNGQYTDDHCCGDVHGPKVTGDKVIACRLSPANTGGLVQVRAHVLYAGGLAMFMAVRQGAGPNWTWVAEEHQKFRFASAAAESADLVNGVDTRFMPSALAPDTYSVTDVFPHEPGRGLHGSCYVTTSGGTGFPSAAGTPVIDTVWWYDGDGNWYPCGVRHTNPRGSWVLETERIVAPALAVVVDPTDPTVVFVGTSVGVIRGVLSFANVGGRQRPSWAWEPMVNGLPESAVNDLSIFSDGTLRLLRAALHGRGVWEVDLANAVSEARTFLRVHPTDTRRRRPTPLSGPAVHGETKVRFDCSPDIVVHTGDVVVDPLGSSEADLVMADVRRHYPVELDDRSYPVDVLVHHRAPFGLEPAKVKVALLRRDLAAGESDPPLAALWPALVAIAGGGAVPATLPGGWQRAEGQLIRQIAGPVDARRPRSARFNVDFTGHADGRVMLLAVVMSDDDQITAAEATKPAGAACTTLSELVVHSRHVAARLVEID